MTSTSRFPADDLTLRLPAVGVATTAEVELIFDQQHLDRIVRAGLLCARVSLDIATADLNTMLIPDGRSRHANSTLPELARMAQRGVEVRLLHSGVPTGPVLHELRDGLPPAFTIRRCPRLHAKLIVVDTRVMYLGGANLTGAGLGAKSAHRRNFELGMRTESAELIESVQEWYNTIWEGARCINCGRRAICPVPLEEPNVA